MTLPQLTRLLSPRSNLQYLKDHSRIACDKSVEDCRQDARNHRLTRADPEFACCRVGQKLDFLHSLLYVIKNCNGPFEQCVTIQCWLHPLCESVKQPHPQRSLHISNRVRYGGLRNRKLSSSFCHAAVLRHRQESIEIA